MIASSWDKKVRFFDDGDTAEDLARMNNKELDKVIDRLVDSYPTLAETLMSRIGYAMLDKEGI